MQRDECEKKSFFGTDDFMDGFDICIFCASGGDIIRGQQEHRASDRYRVLRSSLQRRRIDLRKKWITP